MINNNNNKLVIDNKDTHTQNHEDKELHSSSLLTSHFIYYFPQQNHI